MDGNFDLVCHQWELRVAQWLRNIFIPFLHFCLWSNILAFHDPLLLMAEPPMLYYHNDLQAGLLQQTDRDHGFSC